MYGCEISFFTLKIRAQIEGVWEKIYKEKLTCDWRKSFYVFISHTLYNPCPSDPP
jgi:hypothetical protein